MSIINALTQYWNAQVANQEIDIPLHYSIRELLLSVNDNINCEEVPECVKQVQMLIRQQHSANQTFTSLWLNYITALEEDIALVDAMRDSLKNALNAYLNSKWNDFSSETENLLINGIIVESQILRQHLAQNSELALGILNKLQQSGFFSLLCYFWYEQSLTYKITVPLHQGEYHLMYVTKGTPTHQLLAFPEQGQLVFSFSNPEFDNHVLQMEETFKQWFLLKFKKSSQEEIANTTEKCLHSLLSEVATLYTNRAPYYLSDLTIIGAHKKEIKPWHSSVANVIISNDPALVKQWKTLKGHMDEFLKYSGLSFSFEEPIAIKRATDSLVSILIKSDRPEIEQMTLKV